jgi:hypothetical protein
MPATEYYLILLFPVQGIVPLDYFFVYNYFIQTILQAKLKQSDRCVPVRNKLKTIDITLEEYL